MKIVIALCMLALCSCKQTLDAEHSLTLAEYEGFLDSCAHDAKSYDAWKACANGVNALFAIDGGQAIATKSTLKDGGRDGN